MPPPLLARLISLPCSNQSSSQCRGLSPPHHPSLLLHNTEKAVNPLARPFLRSGPQPLALPPRLDNTRVALNRWALTASGMALHSRPFPAYTPHRNNPRTLAFLCLGSIHGGPPPLAHHFLGTTHGRTINPGSYLYQSHIEAAFNPRPCFASLPSNFRFLQHSSGIPLCLLFLLWRCE